MVLLVILRFTKLEEPRPCLSTCTPQYLADISRVCHSQDLVNARKPSVLY